MSGPVSIPLTENITARFDAYRKRSTRRIMPAFLGPSYCDKKIGIVEEDSMLAEDISEIGCLVQKKTETRDSNVNTQP